MLLSTLYRLKINGSYSEWFWKHALLEKVEEENSDNSAEVDGAKWELPLKVGQDVTIISGDETGLVYFVKDGKANRIAFDASVGTRFISYDDGTYTVEGKHNIKRWLSWSYDKDKNVNYAIQHMTDFLGGDK